MRSLLMYSTARTISLIAMKWQEKAPDRRVGPHNRTLSCCGQWSGGLGESLDELPVGGLVLVQELER